MIALTNTTNKDKDRRTVSWIRKKKKKNRKKTFGFTPKV